MKTEQIQSYNNFLKSKLIKTDYYGIDTNENELNPKLFDFQKKIVKWALKKGKSAIFADTGLGKTPMQLEWSNQIWKRENKPILILSPLAVNHQTKKEGEKFNINVNIANNQEEIVNGINITNYEKLEKFNPESFIAIVMDESSIIKSFTGKTTQKLIEMYQDTKYKLCCTATPSPNDFTELGNHCEFLNVMSRTEMLSMYFINDASDTKTWKLKGHAENDFWRFVGTWSVMIKHPSNLGFSNDGFILPKLTIKDVILDSKLEDFEMFPEIAKGMQSNREARKKSLEDRCNKVKEIVEKDNSNSKWLIWCDYNNESTLLKKIINNSVEIKGSDKLEHKENSMIGFANGDVRILITKPKIAGFGMNWQSCNNVVFCGIGYSYESFYQAIRRCWRFGQKKPVNVYVILSEREIESLKAIKRKEKDNNLMKENVIKNVLSSFNENKTDYDYQINTHSGADYKIMLGDCIERIKEIEDESVHYSIFSPPFSSLYTYNETNRDIGNCRNDKEFYEHMRYLIKELFRIIKSGRNISFHCMLLPTSKYKDGFIGLRDFRGDLIRMFEKEGFIFHSEVVIWKDPVTAMQRTKALGLLHKQLKKDSVMCRQGIPDYLITMRKQGENNDPIKHTSNNYPVNHWQKVASPIWMDINPSDTLQRTSAREEKDEKHICPLQLEVIRRALYLWTNPNDIVFSPFMGIGSEGYVSLELGRRFIGIELKESYYEQSKKNLDVANEKKKQLYLFE